MSSNINTVLADCEKQSKQLIEEIGKYRAATAVSDQTAKSLEALSVSLKETQRRIEPFTALFAKRVLIGIGAALAINIMLMISILLIILTK